MDHNRAKGLSLLHPTCLEKVELVGGMEDVKMEPWNLLVSASFFSKLSLFHSPSNLCPLCLFLSFYLFSYFYHFLLFQCAIPLRSFSSLPPLYFSVSLNHHNTLWCLEQIIPTTITWSSLPFSEHNTYVEKAPFVWCSWKKVVTIGEEGRGREEEDSPSKHKLVPEKKEAIL